MTIIDTDVLIIGAGPVGLFAVFQCGMLRMRCQVVDVLDVVGGQCAALYPEKPIYDIPAHPQISGQDLITQLQQQAAPFNPTYHLGQSVVALKPDHDGFIITTSLGTTLRAKVVFIAAGAGAFGPNRPPLAGIEAFEGRGVYYYVKRRDDFADKRLVIAGGGDSAVDWALSLAPLAKKIYMVHRRDKFRAAPASVRQLETLASQGLIEMVIPYQLHAVGGNASGLTSVSVQQLDGTVRVLEADVLLPFFGLSTNLGPIAEWGLAMDKNYLTVTPSTCATSTPGIYAIGDIAQYPGKYKLILQGFSEAAMAAHDAYQRVHGQALHFEHSTTRGVVGL